MNATPAPRPTLSVNDLCVDLGGAPILRGIDLSVPAGRTVALIGRNGAGKTTTMRSILGLARARAGTLELDGQNLGGLSAHRRARLGIGYVPEDRRMVGSLSVEDNILLPAYACKLDAAARASRLEHVYTLVPELTEFKARLAGSLSGGQQKLVALGRALMIGHRLLLLDEPFQGLSPALARHYAAALAGLRAYETQLAILVSESNPALLESLSHERYTIERGEVAPSEASQAGFSNPEYYSGA